MWINQKLKKRSSYVFFSISRIFMHPYITKPNAGTGCGSSTLYRNHSKLKGNILETLVSVAKNIFKWIEIIQASKSMIEKRQSWIQT